MWALRLVTICLPPNDKQMFKTIKEFCAYLEIVADTYVIHAALPEHVKLLF